MTLHSRGNEKLRAMIHPVTHLLKSSLLETRAGPVHRTGFVLTHEPWLNRETREAVLGAATDGVCRQVPQPTAEPHGNKRTP